MRVSYAMRIQVRFLMSANSSYVNPVSSNQGRDVLIKSVNIGIRGEEGKMTSAKKIKLLGYTTLLLGIGSLIGSYNLHKLSNRLNETIEMNNKQTQVIVQMNIRLTQTSINLTRTLESVSVLAKIHEEGK